MTALEIFILILLIPVGAYLRSQIYRSTHGNATIGGDLRSLILKAKKWRQERQERKERKRKYGYLDKPTKKK